MRNLIVTGVEDTPVMVRTTFFNLSVSRIKLLPAPFAHTPSIGHPMFTSMKSQEISLSINSAHLDMRSG